MTDRLECHEENISSLSTLHF